VFLFELFGQPPQVVPAVLGGQAEDVVMRPMQVVCEEEDLAPQPFLRAYEATKKFDMSKLDS
jgi:hypothetical protein